MQALTAGVPGTGKTYFMVHYLKKHFHYDEFFREFSIASNVLIITNIAELKFYGSSCWNIESPEILGNPMEGIAGKYTREEFFTVANMEKIMLKTGKKNIILVLDEIQREHYFPLGYKNADVLYLFAYHRHIGMDILLGTQDAALISRGVLAQCEYIANGTLRSKKIFGAMSYKFTDNRGNFMYSKTLRTDKAVFNAYQSASVEEVHKPKNAVMHWIVVVVVFLCVAGGLFKTALAMVANKAKPKIDQKKSMYPAATPVAPPPVAAKPSFNDFSAARSTFAVAVPSAQWREYLVEAYIRDGGRTYYMIKGNFVDSVKCRNYDDRRKTVEYFSVGTLNDSRALSGVRSTDSGGGRESDRPAKPVGEAYTPLTWNHEPEPDYRSRTNLSLKPL
jgi:hypothetical protein